MVSESCVKAKEGIGKLDEELSFHDQLEFAKSSCYLKDRSNASGGSEAAVTARTRIGRIKFRECGQLLHERKLLLKKIGRIHQSCARSAMMYGSET